MKIHRASYQEILFPTTKGFEYLRQRNNFKDVVSLMGFLV